MKHIAIFGATLALLFLALTVGAQGQTSSPSSSPSLSASPSASPVVPAQAPATGRGMVK